MLCMAPSFLEPSLHGMFPDDAAFALHSIGHRLTGFGLHIEVIKHKPAAAGGGRQTHLAEADG